MQSSWDGESENHKGPHYVLTIFLNGKMVLTTPDTIGPEQIDSMSAIVQRWLRSTEQYPLIIGDCLVQIVTIALQEASVERPA